MKHVSLRGRLLSLRRDVYIRIDLGVGEPSGGLLMNEDIMRKLGYTNEIERIKNGRCAICNCVIRHEDFRDQLSYEEFNISGMCQGCQDKMFGSEV